MVLTLHEWKGGLEPIQGSMEACWVGIEMNYIGVGLRNDLDDRGVWADLEEGGNKLRLNSAESTRADLVWSLVVPVSCLLGIGVRSAFEDDIYPCGECLKLLPRDTYKEEFHARLIGLNTIYCGLTSIWLRLQILEVIEISLKNLVKRHTLSEEGMVL